MSIKSFAAKLFTLALLARGYVAAQPVQLQLIAPVPPAPVGGGRVIGATGGQTIFYWVVAHYPSGVVQSLPIPVPSTVGIQNLNAQNYVTLQWTPLANATAYDVVRREANAIFPSTCNACAILKNAQATTVQDMGGGSSYTSGTAATSANGTLYLNNIVSAQPLLDLNLNGFVYQIVPAVTGPGAGGYILTGVGVPSNATCNLPGIGYIDTSTGNWYTCPFPTSTTWVFITGTGASGAANSKTSFAAQSTISIAGAGTSAVLVGCYDTSGNAIGYNTAQVSQTTPFNVTVTFLTPQTGYCALNAAGSGFIGNSSIDQFGNITANTFTSTGVAGCVDLPDTVNTTSICHAAGQQGGTIRMPTFLNSLSATMGLLPVACAGSPGNTTAFYLQQCQSTGGIVYACNNAVGCTVAADWVAQGGGGVGTVTSVAATSPITVSPSPITGAGTVACATCGVTGSPLSQFAATTSAQLAGVLSDETGTGVAVFSVSPALTGTPTVPTAVAGTNTNQAASTAFVQTASGPVGIPSNVIAQSTSQSIVTLATAPSAGSYTLRYYADLNTPCTTGSNAVTFTFNWTDASNARLLATGTFTLAAAQSTGTYISGLLPIWVGSGNVTYTSTVSGTCATGTSSYDMHAWLEAN